MACIVVGWGGIAALLAWALVALVRHPSDPLCPASWLFEPRQKWLRRALVALIALALAGFAAPLIATFVLLFQAEPRSGVLLTSVVVLFWTLVREPDRAVEPWVEAISPVRGRRIRYLVMVLAAAGIVLSVSSFPYVR